MLQKRSNIRVMFSLADKMNAGDSKGFAGGGRLIAGRI